MIRRILLPLDNSKYTQTGLKYAKRIAKRTDGEISGMVILDLKGIDDAVGPYVPGGTSLVEMLEKKEEKEAQEHIDTLLDMFRTSCSEDNVKHREFEYQGSPSNNIIKESFFYDMLIIGMRTFFHFEELGTDFKTEILAGTTTFLTMAYIIVVNPAILSDPHGAQMDFSAVMVATCVASAVATILPSTPKSVALSPVVPRSWAKMHGHAACARCCALSFATSNPHRPLSGLS